MTTIKYTITLFSEWHAGSGLTSGSDKDALVIKDKRDLPYIPGRTLKGLLKEAAEELIGLGAISSADFIEKVFGLSADTKTEDDKNLDSDVDKPTIMGSCFFSNAGISDDLSKTVTGNKLQSFFYRSISSTAINSQKGMAVPHSLRVMETTIPCTLYAEIHEFPKDFEDDIIMCFQWTKRLGQNRNRGLGRCKFEIKT